MRDNISIKGAREHNLKNIDLELPRNKLIVITGLSGSGKSTLAFDTIYAEGQRRYVESLSAYARQFLGLMDKPDVDSIEGLSPAKTPAPQLEQSQKSTITSDYFLPVSALITAPNAEAAFTRRALRISPASSWQKKTKPSCSLPQSSEA
jgi:excinuclease UvrABC ATPase subunit